MKYLHLVFFSSIFLFSKYSLAQRSVFSIGIKGGFGFSVPDPNTSMDQHGHTYSMRTHITYAGGILGQYILGDKVGVETGIANTFTAYSRKDQSGSTLPKTFGWYADAEIASYQIPFQLMYIMRFRTHPNMRIKITGGIAMDWLVSDFNTREESPLFVPSLLSGIRIKSRTGKYGHIEYGFEYKCTLNGSYDFSMDIKHNPTTIHSRYSIVSFNLYYFFYNKGQ